MRTLVIALTQFGDVAVLIPLATIIMIWLFLICSLRCATWWIISVLLCLMVTFGLKFAFYQCPPIPQLQSASGHTSLSTLIYGAITLVAAAEAKDLLKKIMLCGGVSLILGIAASRLYLDAHSLPEVGLGFLVGAVSLIVFIRSYRQLERVSVTRVILLVIVSGILTIVLHGRTFNTEILLHKIARNLQIYCT